MQTDGERWPPTRLLRLEHPKVGRHQLGRAGFQQTIDGRADFVRIQLIRQFLDTPLPVMRHSDAVEEIDEEILMAFEQPDLEDVFRRAVARLQLDRFDHPVDLRVQRLPLDEDGSEPALVGQGNQGSLVNVSVVFPEAAEDILRKLGGHGLEQLKGSHGIGSGAAWTSSSKQPPFSQGNRFFKAACDSHGSPLRSRQRPDMPEAQPNPTPRIETDVAILGGGIAALWTAHVLRDAGFGVAVFTNADWGAGQTLAAQGVIHGGLKYALGGKLTDSSEALAAMPGRWRQSLAGKGEIDLRGVTVLSPSQILWSLPQVLSKVVAFFGSQSLRNRAGALAREDYPPPFQHPDYRGQLFELDEMVVDPVTLVAALAGPLQDCARKWNGTASWNTDPAGRITEAVFPDASGRPVTLRARHWVLAAGAGNGDLLRSMGRQGPAMQLRPLHQVIIRSRRLPPLFSVCIGTGIKPPVVTTTHIASDGTPLWYVGGDLAETGVERSESAQIDFARARFRELLPWLDLADAGWATLRVDRAEPRTGSGERPPGAFVDHRENVFTVWPTKLALAPDLASQVHHLLRNAEPHPSGRVTGLEAFNLHVPAPAKAPWDFPSAS